MSRTDKDRPLWVQNAEHGRINHDHRSGKCIISDDQRDRWPKWNHHFSTKCKKRVRVEFGCRPMKVDGRRKVVFELDNIKWRRDNAKKSCWAWTCDCPYTQVSTYVRVYEDSSWGHPTLCEHRYFNKCLGHWGYVYDDSIPCSCDDRPEPATCTPAWEIGRYYTYGGVPSWFVRQIYHGPERARERKLNDARRMYNAGEDIEDFDFENRQAHNSARWDWW